MEKRVIKLASGKGKLLPVLQNYLESIGFAKIENSRKLVHRFEKEDFILEVVLLRWEDIKRYSSSFDMILYGSDQWLESGHKKMVSLKYFEQNNLRISMLVKKEQQDLPFSYFKERKVATSFPTLAKEYIGIKEENIVPISGSVEAAVTLGWADSIFDIVETGTSALENGLVEYKPFVKFGATLATEYPEEIPLFEKLGLIKKQSSGKIIAFDGIDGSGKTTLAKYLVQNPSLNSNSTVLILPYQGKVGTSAKELWNEKMYYEWATIIGRNHWRAPKYVNSIYDRSILTFMTDLIKEGLPDEKIIEAIKTWSPLPDILFFCDISPEEAMLRRESSKDQDEFDSYQSLKEYYDLYQKAIDFVKKYNLVEIVKIDTTNPVSECVEKIKNELNQRFE